MGITSSVIGLKKFTITARIKNYKRIIKKKKKKHDKIVLLAKNKLYRIEVLIFKTLIDSNISLDDSMLIKNVLKEYDNLKEEINNFNEVLLFKLQKETEMKTRTVANIKNGRILLLSNCAVRNNKLSRFIKKEEASGLLDSLGIKTALSKNLLVSLLLF